jgi:type VI protein secretion system component Hcp
MYRRVSVSRGILRALLGVFPFVLLPAQTVTLNQAFPGVTNISVSVNGLACNGTAQGVFAATAFQIAVNTITASGGAGAGAGKTVFGDLLVQKASDGCSLPLFILAAKDQPISEVVLNATDKSNKPVFTITIDNVLLVGSQLKGSPVDANAGDSLDFSYATITIKDASGNTIGPVTR